MKKKIFFNISIILMFVLTGCGSTVIANENSVDIGVILPEKDEYKWEQTINVMKKYANLAGNKLDVKYTMGTMQNEATNIHTFIAQGAKVLIICSDNSEKTSQILEECDLLEENNVTIISYEKLICNTDKVQYFVSYDSITIGKAQGAYLVNNARGADNPLYLFAGDSTEEENVKLFEGAWKALWPKINDGTFTIQNSENAVRLKKKSVLTNYELVEIMNEINERRYRTEKELLKDCGKEKYILAPYDKNARDICDYLTANDYKSKYYITGSGTEENSVKYILDNKQSMSVYEKESILAKDAICIANTILFDKDVNYDILSYNGKVDVKVKQSQPVTIVKNNIEKELEKN